MPALVAIASKTLMTGSSCSNPTHHHKSVGGACFAELDDRNRVHVVAELQAPEVNGVKEFMASPRMQNVFRQVNAMSTTPLSSSGSRS